MTRQASRSEVRYTQLATTTQAALWTRGAAYQLLRCLREHAGSSCFPDDPVARPPAAPAASLCFSAAWTGAKSGAPEETRYRLGMGWRAPPTVSWSVRPPDGHPHGVDTAVHELLQSAFPETAGYCIERRRLSGPMTGSVFSVRRGDFRARVSLQRYRRGPLGAEDAQEIRLVGSAVSARMLRAQRAASRWQILGRVAGIVATSISLLVAAWAASRFAGQDLMAVASPLWVAWVVPAGVTSWMAGASVRASLQCRGQAALAAVIHNARQDQRLDADVRAWSAAVPALSGQRELAMLPPGDRPFRVRGRPAPLSQ